MQNQFTAEITALRQPKQPSIKEDTTLMPDLLSVTRLQHESIVCEGTIIVNHQDDLLAKGFAQNFEELQDCYITDKTDTISNYLPDFTQDQDNS